MSFMFSNGLAEKKDNSSEKRKQLKTLFQPDSNSLLS